MIEGFIMAGIAAISLGSIAWFFVCVIKGCFHEDKEIKCEGGCNDCANCKQHH